MLTAESLGIDSENHLFDKLNSDYSSDFPALIHRCNFIRRRKGLVTSAKGMFHSMDVSKASVHDIHYINDIKHSGLNNCTLIGDQQDFRQAGCRYMPIDI